MTQRTSIRASAYPAVALFAAATAVHAQMTMESMPDDTAPADARDSDAYSDGVGFTRGAQRSHFADEQRFYALMFDVLEATRVDGHSVVPYDIEGWFGQTYDRAVLRAEGDLASGDLAEASTELLWGHALTPYWDSMIGVRYDSGPGPNRSWLAAGIEGLAPYRFDLEVTAYVGESNRTALRVDAAYEMLLTQRLILEPRFEANWYGRSDRARGLGAGLADTALALRLRYEFRRELAPYIGVEWNNRYGGTEMLARAADDDPSDTRLVMGLRFWF